MLRFKYPAEELLAGLPREQRISTIVGVLSDTEYNDETGLWLFEALKRLQTAGSTVNLDHPFALSLRQLRTYLQEVYTKATSAGRVKSGTHPQFLSAILQEILKGWQWYWDWKDGKSSGYSRQYERKESDDAEECFVFFCGAFNDWTADKKFQEMMLGLLREHLSPTDNPAQDNPWWYPTDLDRWILCNTFSAEIAQILLHARVRHEEEGLRIAQAEMEFLGPFDLHVRSKQAVSVAQQALQKVQTIDCILQRIAERARPSNRRGDQNPSSPLGYVDDLEVSYDTTESARVYITFHRPQDVNPGAIEGVRKIRDEVQSELPYPFIIKVTAKGPNGFTYSEP